ncbi:head-to-tail stopper [Arthrobacter phage Kepler]|uniref:Head-to-tail stopper n=2 Tax=Coralvirus TaxID=2733171 RepID=A0A3G2KFC8_9CAUD|nr:head closure Hc1 [Arthrobacter phage Kepler]AYN57660.1 head-to-tail stopper [Arthrobacter phage Daob]AYN58238.1 head-to-tail stopper [Arthrobacter phage Kepler]
MLPSFATQQITVVRPAWVTDGRGVRKPDYGDAAARTVVPGCSVQPGASPELVQPGRTTATIRFTVLAPPSVVVESADGVEYRGRLYAVDGEPLPWESPTGALDHVGLFLIDWK